MIQEAIEFQKKAGNDPDNKNELLTNLHQLHTTELGVMRIKRNLSLDTNDVVEWCRTKIGSPNAAIKKSGKNWYVTIDGCIITINSYSFTIITAHREKSHFGGVYFNGI